MRLRGAIFALTAAAVGAVVVPACSNDTAPQAGPTTTTLDRVAAFCPVAAELSNQTDLFAAVETAGGVAEAEQAFTAVLTRIRPLADDPPAEIADAAKDYVEGVEAYGALLAAVDHNGSKVDRDRLAEVIAQVGRAQAELEAYALKTCR